MLTMISVQASRWNMASDNTLQKIMAPIQNQERRRVAIPKCCKRQTTLLAGHSNVSSGLWLEGTISATDSGGGGPANVWVELNSTTFGFGSTVGCRDDDRPDGAAVDHRAATPVAATSSVASSSRATPASAAAGCDGRSGDEAQRRPCDLPAGAAQRVVRPSAL